ncbi:outer membrane beta-barrel protein [Salegentibacter salarius]|uniref:Outer membrane protein beta-barrel domain-containing protein n=1 Tax=Salegentibacter salarius TaxID=435906 RepID=A0A2N0TNJ1_9FLAO|nr:outer membrane beta-barrel protein [Salegentibacter salarius]OEY71500.1 hypothetical protein BHS39_05045 [Salegentibacter salarius]PKD16290.1 hypothetical protein APR40_05045 [Salegentibacter salarius]SLJ89912.1 Outer membrane protein beta-barrel domain-containing protein [Salegentibacter salarius]
MNKILLVFTLFSLFSFNSQAQDNYFPIKEKTLSIGGGASIRLNQTDYEAALSREVFALNLRPNVGYAIGENLMLGVGLGYSYNETTTDDSVNNRDQTANGVGVFPFIRKYFNINNRFALDLTGELGYEHSWGTNYTVGEGYESTANRFEASIRPGISYFVSDHIALNAQLGGIFYQHTSRKVNGELDTRYNSLVASLQMEQFYFGINFFL